MLNLKQKMNQEFNKFVVCWVGPNMKENYESFNYLFGNLKKKDLETNAQDIVNNYLYKNDNYQWIIICNDRIKK